MIYNNLAYSSVTRHRCENLVVFILFSILPVSGFPTLFGLSMELNLAYEGTRCHSIALFVPHTFRVRYPRAQDQQLFIVAYWALTYTSSFHI